MLDVVVIGQGGSYWIHALPSGAFEYGGVIVPGSDGTLADLALTDLDQDGRVDAIAAFSDGPARMYRQIETGVFTLGTWTSTTSGATRIALCAEGSDFVTDVVLAGPGGVEEARRQSLALSIGQVVIPDAVTDIACGPLEPNVVGDSLVTVTP